MDNSTVPKEETISKRYSTKMATLGRGDLSPCDQKKCKHKGGVYSNSLERGEILSNFG